MQHKIWHKPLHQRKVWKQMSLPSKIIYYMQPFVEHLLDTWLQPLPFPTILKLLYSCVLTVFILLPVIYPSVVLLSIYAELQFLWDRHVGISFPTRLNLLRYGHYVMHYQVSNEKHKLFMALYVERWRLFAAALSSSIDYIRLALCLLYEVVES